MHLLTYMYAFIYTFIYIHLSFIYHKQDIELIKRLISEFQVAVLPGSAFGVDDSQLQLELQHKENYDTNKENNYKSHKINKDNNNVDKNNNDNTITNNTNKDYCYVRVAYGALQKETVVEGINR